MDVPSHRASPAPLARLLLVLAVAFGLRLLPLLCHGNLPGLFMEPDSWGYHRLACSLAAGHGYTWDTQPPYTPNLYRVPGLPLLLSGLYLLIGPSISAAIVLQAFLGTAAVWLTFLLARRLNLPPGTALIAAAVLALDPLAIRYSNLLLTEVYTSLLLLLLLGCLANYRTSARPLWLLAGGAVLAVGILVHPILLFLPVLLLGAPLLAHATRNRRHLVFALAALVLAWTPATLWMVRNWHVGDYFGLTCVTAVNLLKYKAAGTEAALHGTSRETERDRLTQECDDQLPSGATPGDRYRLWQRRGTAILLAHPLVYAKLHAKGMLMELIGPERDLTARFVYGSAVLDEEGVCTDERIAEALANRPSLLRDGIRYLILGWQALLGLGLLIGTWQLARRRPGLLLALLIVPLYVLLLSGGPEAEPRFRVLYLPIFSLLTALGARAFAAALQRPPALLIAGERQRTAGRTLQRGQPAIILRD